MYNTNIMTIVCCDITRMD